ncbi:MAG: aminoacyl-histidine dipeptidase [Oscillospiraceae bacterium]
MAVLEHLEPGRVFHFFEQMSAIPRGSGNTKAVSDWLAEFARERGLRYQQDALNNIIIFKDASAGYEGAEPVILQGHMDMVCEKAPDCGKDMTREGLDLAIDGDFVYAKGTTLGGDDGIAVAMALAVLDDESLPHPPIEVVITVDEETGMDGAMGIDVSGLKGRRMLNIDSEDEGVFTVSCAGGARMDCVLPVRREAFAAPVQRITVQGLVGGHSGTEIDKGRGNGVQLMGRVLASVAEETELRLVEVCGGLKDNAIPTGAQALISANAEVTAEVCRRMTQSLREEYRVTDPDVEVTVEPAETAMLPMDAVSTRRAVCLLVCHPNGVQVMSADIPGLVQTSLNMGILTTGETAVHLSSSVRSSVESQKQMLLQRIACLTAELGGETSTRGEYPGWAYLPDSPLRDLMVEVFTDQYGYEPKVEAIHAGLECGLFSAKLPGLDCVSFGPDLKEIHTFREKMSISSVQRVWKMLVKLLRRMKP